MRSCRLFPLAAGLLLALAACATEPATPGRPTSPSAKRAVGESARPGVPLAEILGAAYEHRADGSLALLDRLAAPSRVEAEPVENRYVPGQTDTLRKLVYDGLELDVYEAAGGDELLTEVRVTSAGYETDGGLHVGMRRSKARRLLGSVVLSGDTLVHLVQSAPGDPTPARLLLRFDGNDLAAMTWRFYVDR